MQRAIIIITLILLSFGLKAQVYQAMPQAGYGPVKRMLFDSVLTIPLNINQLRNITGGRDAGQIRYNVTDSGLYVYSGYQWIKANLDSSNISNRINGKLNISDTAQMLSVYLRKRDTISLSNRIDLRVKYSDTAAMLLPYLRKLDTASLSRRIDEKQNLIKLTTNFKSGAATLIRDTLNIPKYSDTLTAYVPYVGATTDVTLGDYGLRANKLKSDFLLELKNQQNIQNETLDYTSIGATRQSFSYYTQWMQGQTTYTQGSIFIYSNLGQQSNTRLYTLPVRDGTLALVEDTVNLSNRINLKADKSTTLTINGQTYDLSANRTWTIPTFDSTSISNRINLKLNISDTAAMLSPYLRKADTSSLSNRIDLRVKYSDTAAMLSPYLKSAVTSVGLSMPAAFTVTNSPVTSTGTIAVTGAGTAAQYIRGDGQLATLPSGAIGGSSVAYYLNGSVNQGTIGGSVYYEMNKTPIIGAGTDFSLAGNGLISQFITDVADPNRLQIPAGNWNFEMYMSASSSGGTPKFYVELLKYDGTNFTSIASSSANPEAITNGTTIDLYVTALAIPQTTLLATDRLAIRVYIVNSTGGRTITMHTENSHLCEIITNFAGGVSALNGLTANTQYLAVGTSGNDFAINSLTDTHTFNLPTASSTKRGALSSADWSTFNGKMNYSDTASLSNRINLKLNSSDTVSLSNRINTKLNSTDTASLSNRINAKADALSGTTNTVPKFTSGTTIGNSNIKDNGSAVSVNTTAGSFGALQVGSYNGNILMNTTNTSGGLIFQNTSSSNKLWDFSSDNNDLAFNESNVAPVIKLKAGGNVQVYNLSGTGTRMVVADLNGVLSTQAISSDTTSLSNRINLKLNISDTASMLSGYQSAINSKQATITLTTTGTSGAATFSSNTLNIPQYQAAGTYVTSVTGTSPIVSSGGTTPAISIPAATSSVNGYLSSTDWSTFNGKVSTATLSGYLPLTGGALTGSLSITSGSPYALDVIGTARISGNVTLTGTYTDFRQTSYLRFSNTGGGTRWGYIQHDGTNMAFFNDIGGGAFTFNKAASFASSIVTGGGTIDASLPEIQASGTIMSTGSSLAAAPTTASVVLDYQSASNSGRLMAGSAGAWNKNIAINPYGGNTMIGTTTDAGYKLDVNGTGRFSATDASYPLTLSSTVSAANQNYLKFAAGGTTIGTIYRPSGTNAVAITTNYEALQILNGLAVTGAATFSSSVMVNNSTVSTEGLSVQYNQAKTYTTQTAVSRWHSNESSGSQFKLNLFAIGNATGSSRVFKFQTSNEGVANDGVLSFQSDGGNVGIGTTSPSSYGNLTVVMPSASNGTGIVVKAINDGGSSSQPALTYLNGSGNPIAQIVADNGTGYLAFNTSTSNVERMRILSSSGNIQMGGTTAASARLFVKGISTSSADVTLLLNDINNADLFYVRNDGFILTGNRSVSPYNNSTTGRSMVIEPSGGLGYLVSTRESKANIKSINNINFINQLNPVSFNYRKKNNGTNTFTNEVYDNKTYGFIADEVEKVNKDLVFYDIAKDGTKKLAGVEYNSMIAILVKAVQELQKRIEILENK